MKQRVTKNSTQLKMNFEIQKKETKVISIQRAQKREVIARIINRKRP